MRREIAPEVVEQGDNLAARLSNFKILTRSILPISYSTPKERELDVQLRENLSLKRIFDMDKKIEENSSKMEAQKKQLQVLMEQSKDLE